MSSSPNKTQAQSNSLGKRDAQKGSASAGKRNSQVRSGSLRRNLQPVRMTSITRKLHFMYIRKRLRSIILVTIGIPVLCFLAFAVYQELDTFGSLAWDRQRSFSVTEEPWLIPGHQMSALYYCVEDSILPAADTDKEPAAGADREAADADIEADGAAKPAAGEAGQTDAEIDRAADRAEPAAGEARRVHARFFPEGLIVLCPVLVLLVIRLLNILLSWRSENRKIRKILRPINELALRADELSKLSFSEDKYQILENAITRIDPEKMQSLSFGDSDLAGVETAMNNLLIRMKESYRQQARFVNDASHELRTPIAIIEGYANMLDRWGTEDEKVLTESITAIKNESSHMKHLVEQLLFLARGDSGRTELQMEQVSLTGLMQEIYEESLMIDEQHHYKYTPPQQDIVVQADMGMLKQAVRILVDNAAKYTKENDEILLSVGEAQGHPYLQVQDSGIGMAEADVLHMFDRFYRSDEVRKYKGTGLGLSISKWIVDKHGGHFEVTSRQELGTRIRIVL